MLLTSRIVLFFFAFLLGFINSGACADIFGSCQEIKLNTPSDMITTLTDGFYYIKLRTGIGIQVYCYGMESSTNEAREYLHMQSGRSRNYAEKYQYVGSTQSCTLEEAPEKDFDEYGRTEFEKLLFDPRTRKLVVDDFTFATNVKGRFIKFGHAGDKHSYSRDCVPMGSFSMDFTGTPFVVNQDVIWKWQGSFANGDNSMGKALIDDKRYLGCYIDQSSRDLPDGPWKDNSMTSALCIKHCFEKGYKYAGTQYFSECFCGNSYGNHGKADELDCNLPCHGDNEEMCGGNLRNSVYKTENTQTTEGHCGGYPGFCYPALHDSEITVKVDLYEKHPCVVSSPCFNAGICIATGLDQFFCRCHKGTSGTFCELVEQPQTFLSEATSTSDDAVAFVACPAGTMAVSCECERQYCDGAWFVGDECRVTNSNQGQKSKGKITCWQYDPTYQRLINVESTDMHNPFAQCPEHSIMTGCAALDWLFVGGVIAWSKNGGVAAVLAVPFLIVCLTDAHITLSHHAVGMISCHQILYFEAALQHYFRGWLWKAVKVDWSTIINNAPYTCSLEPLLPAKAISSLKHAHLEYNKLNK